VATAEAKRKPGRGELGDFTEPTIRLWKLPASLPLVQENEAEKLFRAVEKKISGARAFRVAVDIKISENRGEGKATEGRLKGSLVLTKDNKARLTIRGKVAGEAVNIEIVSDGKHITWKDSLPEPPALATQTTPKMFHALLSTLMTRAGVYGSSGCIAVANGFGEEIPASVQRIDAWDFKVGAAAKVGGRDARVVRYKVGFKGEKGAGQAILWIDSRTLLPLRYVIGDGTGGVTETYNEFTLDPKVDAKVFALPK
jgi:outer membrane lipoprotein-sorting protein